MELSGFINRVLPTSSNTIGGGSSYDDTEVRQLIQANSDAIETLGSTVEADSATVSALNDAVVSSTAAIQAFGGRLQELWDSKVDKVSGKVLSTNDYTTTEKTKLSGIAAGAQVNVIETIKVNGTALTPSNKEVNIEIPDTPTPTPGGGSNEVLTLNAIYNGASTTTLSDLSIYGTTPDAGGYFGILHIRRLVNSTQHGSAVICVSVIVNSSTDIALYYKGELFAHLYNENWVVDYDGSVLVPVWVDPTPEPSEDKYVVLVSNDESTEAFVGDGVFSFWLLWPSEYEREYAVFKKDNTKLVALSLMNGVPDNSSSLKYFSYSWYPNNMPSTFENISGGVIEDTLIEIDEVVGFDSESL